MSRWFRFYDGSLDDPKVQSLPGDLFKIWVNLLCVASKCNGACNVTDLPFMLRMDAAIVDQAIGNLLDRGLLDEREDGCFEPHNWAGRQYKSDTSNERVKQHRDRKRNAGGNVTPAVTVTPPEQIQNTEHTNANALGADAPTDWRDLLWREGPTFLSHHRGMTIPAAKSLIGKWLKLVGDDCRTLLEKIREAERERVIDAVSWIEASIRPPPKPRSVGEMFRDEARKAGILPDDTSDTLNRRLEKIHGDGLAPGAGSSRLIAFPRGG